ncbi:MAG: chondroitinase-B domain-containing protein, partial [Desulfovermiculus sp.]
MHTFIRKPFLLGFFLCFLLLMSQHMPSWGLSYYVSDSGVSSDMNSGTQDDPLRTVQEALNRAVPGDEVIIGTGTYREELQLGRSGTSDHPITIKAQVPGEAFLMGSDVVEGWQLSHDHIWFKPNWEVNSQQVFVDGQSLQQIGSNCVYHDIAVQDGTALPITGSDVSDMFAGSFWYDSEFGQLYVWLPDGSSPQEHFMEASVRPFVVAPNSQSFITLQDVVFAHSNSGAGTEAKAMVNIGGDNWTLHNTQFLLADLNGLSLSGRGHTLMENTFVLNGLCGMTISGLQQDMDSSSDPQDIRLSINETSLNNDRQFHYSINPSGLTITGQANTIAIDRHLAWQNHMYGIFIDSDCREIGIDQSFFADNIISAYCKECTEINLQNSIFSKNIYGIGLDTLRNSHFSFNTLHSNTYGMLITSSLGDEGGNSDLYVQNTLFNNNSMLDLGIYDQQFITDTNDVDYNAYARDTQDAYTLWVDFLGLPRMMTQLSSFQEQTGLEGHAVVSPSLWADEEHTFIPGENTAVVDQGQFSNQTVPEDFYGFNRPWGSAPDIGAVEYRPDMDPSSYPHELTQKDPSLPEQPPEPATWTLNLSTQGQGSISVDPELFEYTQGTPVELTAVPESGWE